MLIRRASLICFLVTAICGTLLAAGDVDDLAVLSEAESSGLLRQVLLRQSDLALDRRLETVAALQTVDQIRDYQARMRSGFRERLGEFPPRTPLNSRTIDTFAADGVVIEKVIYESRPGFYVTANVYLPAGRPPFPGVLFPCGHSEVGKAEEAYQQACGLLARNGMVVLCYDPIGQGERKQILSESGAPAGRFRATSEHMLCGVAPILLGENLATYRIWDGIRGLDYLASRADVDGERLGCTGNSGGGLMTSYLMALDPRIRAAAPSCFITTTRRKNVSPGPGDAEQNIFGQIGFGLDHPDFLLMRAPQPTLICAATQDFVPIEGSWEAFRQAKQVYTRFDASERVDLVEADERHGFSQPLRHAVVRFMRRWLLDQTGDVDLKTFSAQDPATLQCTPAGQVLLMSGARSIFDLNRSSAERLARVRERLRRTRPPAETRDRIRQLAGIRQLAATGNGDVQWRGRIGRDGYEIQKLTLTSADQMTLPALLFTSPDARGTPIVHVHDGGKHLLARPGGEIEAWVLAGRPVLAVDLRGYGETDMKPWRYTGLAPYVGNNGAEFFVAYMLGRSFVGLRVEDILAAAGFVRERFAAPNVELVAVGGACVPALHAAALEPAQFSALRLSEGLDSWDRVVSTAVTVNQLENTVHGALRHYDLADLIGLYGGAVDIQHPRDAGGQPLQ